VKRALPLLAIVWTFASCGFAQRHPAVTATIVGATVGYGGCAMDNADPATCGIIGGSTAVFLGGIVALVGLFADTNAHVIPPDEGDVSEPGTVRVHTSTEPPPAAIDAGVDAALDAAL
jgi:hypothetical protein